VGKGVAVVEHRVSTDPVYCTFDSPDDGFGERSQCRYQKECDRLGKGGVIARRLPRCTLFNVWLEKPGIYCIRCDACKAACGELEVVK